ncbi:MAG: ZPR1 zinc finger domain-containing protein [Thermoplasmatota archaeon]
MDTQGVKCPACIVGELNIISEQLKVPHFGDVVISTMICDKCGYRTSDVIPVEIRPPKRFSIVIDRPEKLNTRIVRSGTSTVRIPEIGARLDPGLFSEGFITNVEGVLRRFRDILMQLLRDLQDPGLAHDQEKKRDHAIELIEVLGSYVEGDPPSNRPLTIILEDPMGTSAIISQDDGDVKEEDLTKEEITDLLESRIEKDLITEL